MQERFERIQAEPDEVEEPKVRRSADIIPIEKAASAKKEAESGFAAYQASGGHLTAAEYQRITEYAGEANTNARGIFSSNARSYANNAGIDLSPESLALYSLLRSDEDISSELSRGDQQILAETLRILGKTDDVRKLIDTYPNIDF